MVRPRCVRAPNEEWTSMLRISTLSMSASPSATTSTADLSGSSRSPIRGEVTPSGPPSHSTPRAENCTSSRFSGEAGKTQTSVQTNNEASVGLQCEAGLSDDDGVITLLSLYERNEIPYIIVVDGPDGEEGSLPSRPKRPSMADPGQLVARN